MDELKSSVTRVIDQAMELTQDQQPILANLASHLEPYSDELIQAWCSAYRDARVRDPMPPEGYVRSSHEEIVRVIVGSLTLGYMREYFEALGRWGQVFANSGLRYDSLLTLMSEYRRLALPFILKAYPSGPELQVTLSALDGLYTGSIMVLGAAFVQAVQDQLVSGAHWRPLGRLASGASHTLNNVLTAILGHAQLSLDKPDNSDLSREMREIQHAATAGAQVVRRLQDFETRDDKFVALDPNSIVRDAAEIMRFLWRDEAEASGIFMDVVKDLAEVPPVLGQPSELRHVLVQLVFNAIEAMPKGGLITLRTERRGDDVLISITDTGEGMSEATRRRIFDPFFTTRAPGHFGLGLTIANKIVKSHFGRFDVQSDLGRGTTFTLFLPITQATLQSPGKPMPAASSVPNILIIDDELPVREIAIKFLTFRGYAAAVADSGPEGIEMFKKGNFDLVITDLGMPGMSGWEVAREIKRLSPKTLVVLMTGWSTELDSQKVSNSGVDRVVHKPFDVDEVLALVTEAAALKEKI